MKKCHLDFESRSKVDIWSSGAYVYATHPSTEILCLAYAVDDGPVKIIRYADILTYPMSDPFIELRALANNREVLFYAHNALFEELIWEHKFQPLYKMPRLPINRWRCTAAKALSVGLPKSLSDVSEALDTKHKKDSRGRLVMLKMCKPKADGSFEESPELFAELESYCKRDVETERDIDGRLPELTKEEQYVWFEDQQINKRGIKVDEEAVGIALETIIKETARLKEKVKVLSGGRLDGVSRRLEVLDYVKKNGLTLPDFTKATVEKAIAEGKVSENVLEVLRIRQQLGLSSVAKYQALQEATCQDGRLRDTFMYHSASTGRWGGKLVQLQNLPKGTFDSDLGVEMLKTYDYETLIAMSGGNIMALLSSCIRGMFVASEGKDLIVADYAAIEARVLMWLCGEVEAIKMFKEGKDIYVEMAKRIGQGAPRQLGKQAILACGYGMGASKFRATCETYGIQVSDSLARQSVNAYRSLYPKVKAAWYDQERAAIKAVTGRQKIVCGRISWEVSNDFLWCTLPSSRRLAYHKPEVKTKETEMGEQMVLAYAQTDSITKKYVKKETYGGRLVENITQGIARDILAVALVNSERHGYLPAMHVHDEVVVEIDEKFGSVGEFERLICQLPKWAGGCPISAKAWRGKRYKK